MTRPFRVPLPGSERQPYRDARAVGPSHPDERLQVTVVLKRRGPLDQEALLAAYDVETNVAGRRSSLSRDDFESSFDADPDALAKVEEFAGEHRLAVVRSDVSRRSMVLAGTVADCNAAFGVDLQHFEYDEGTYRGRTGPVHVPAELADAVEAVLGLDNRPQARLHLRSHDGAQGADAAGSGAAVQRAGCARRQRPVDRNHRAGGRLPAGGFERLLRAVGHPTHAQCHGRLGRWRPEQPGRRLRRGRRSDARH